MGLYKKIIDVNEISLLLLTTGSSLKWMVVGVHGDCGANVLKHVVQAHNIARVPVLNPVRDMEENPAQDQTSRPGSAIQDSVPVRI